MKGAGHKAGHFFGAQLLKSLFAPGDLTECASAHGRPASAPTREVMRRALKAARRAAGRYTALCVSTAAAVALTPLVAAAGYNLCLPFCIAVVFGAWYGAIGHGVLAALLSALFLEHFMSIPLSRADLYAEDFKLVGVFALVSLAASWLNISRRRALEEGDETNRGGG